MLRTHSAGRKGRGALRRSCKVAVASLYRSRPLGCFCSGVVGFCSGEVDAGEDAVMGYAKYIGRVGALAVALGIGTALAATPWVASAESVHLRVVLGLCIDASADSTRRPARRLRNRGGVGQVGFRPVDGVRIDRDLEEIAEESGDINIGVARAVGVVAACDAFGRAGCGGEHRRRGHKFTGRFLPVRPHRPTTAAGGSEPDSTDATSPAQPTAAPASRAPRLRRPPERGRGEHTRRPHHGTRQQRRRHPRRC